MKIEFRLNVHCTPEAEFPDEFAALVAQLKADMQKLLAGNQGIVLTPSATKVSFVMEKAPVPGKILRFRAKGSVK